jgi:L-lactate dehydrogenase complex protein LldG
MTSRDAILARIRRNQPASRPLPELPTFGQGADRLLGRFRAAVVRMGGRFLDAPADGDLAAFVRRLFPEAKVICSATAEVEGNRSASDVPEPAGLDDVDVAVVRAAFGVAETGSVWLTDDDFGISALGFLSQHLVVLLDPDALLGNMQDAYRQRAQFDARYGVFMTGPSATADIEGILIHGAQGIRSMTIVAVARRDGRATF